MRHLRHWESYLAIVACGVLSGVGGYLGAKYFGHPAIFAGIGGGMGGVLLGKVVRYVDLRYHKTSPEP